MELAIFIALAVGVCLELILMRLLRYGMGLKNIPGQVMMVIIGIVLVCGHDSSHLSKKPK